MSSEKPPFPSERNPDSLPVVSSRRQFLRALGAAAALSAIPGCAGNINKVSYPKTVDQVDQKTKDRLLTQLGANYDGIQRDGSSLSFAIGNFPEAKRKAATMNRKEMEIGESVEITNETANTEIAEDIYLVCVRTRKKETIKPTRRHPYYDLDKKLDTGTPIQPAPQPKSSAGQSPASAYSTGLKDKIPTVPEKPVVKKAPENTYTSFGGFREAVETTKNNISKYRIAGLYNRYIVKPKSLKKKKAPEGSFVIKVTVDEHGTPKKLNISGMNRALRKMHFDRIISNYSGQWKFPSNPLRKRYRVNIPITLKAPEVEK